MQVHGSYRNDGVDTVSNEVVRCKENLDKILESERKHFVWLVIGHSKFQVEYSNFIESAIIRRNMVIVIISKMSRNFMRLCFSSVVATSHTVHVQPIGHDHIAIAARFKSYQTI
jgi:hypothetical protein